MKIRLNTNYNMIHYFNITEFALQVNFLLERSILKDKHPKILKLRMFLLQFNTHLYLTPA